MFTVNRSPNNPILSPVREHPWEAAAAFNGCPIMKGKKMMMVYRAMSEPDLLKEPHIRTSVIARADSKDGFHFENRAVLVSPDADYDQFGCEDPRVTKIGSTYYIFYTALGGYPYSADNIKVAVALSKDLSKITEKHLVTPFNAKAMALFPQKVNGKLAALLTVNTDRKPSELCYAEFEKAEDIWSPEYWTKWYENLDSHKIQVRRRPEDHIELGAPPLLTDKGWLVVYSHIQRYGKSDQVFGIETVLLDKDDPKKVIGNTKGPIMVAEEYYEHTGQVAHVIFPSGALIRDERLEIYYGAADTHCAVASVPLGNLLESMVVDFGNNVAINSVAKRFPGNPIIMPRNGFFWEDRGTLNPAVIDLDGKISILYRAVSERNVSTIGCAISEDGFSISKRSDKPIYVPRESFEMNDSNSNCGCEDPRLMEIGEKIFMVYTAYDGAIPRVAVSSINTKDFKACRWGAWSKPRAITPSGIPDKDAVILPEVVNGKYMVIHRVGESICADFVSSLDFEKETIDKCIEILGPRRGMWDGHKVGISTPPIKTTEGWLLLYHGVSWSAIYRVGAILLDLDDPTIVKARTAAPILEPTTAYEASGIIPNVVFPCGMIVRKNLAYIYYGGADKVVGVATIAMSRLLGMLRS